jgi:hypothetical protein
VACELLLEPLVRVVDAQLLERVDHKLRASRQGNQQQSSSSNHVHNNHVDQVSGHNHVLLEGLVSPMPTSIVLEDVLETHALECSHLPHLLKAIDIQDGDGQT